MSFSMEHLTFRSRLGRSLPAAMAIAAALVLLTGCQVAPKEMMLVGKVALADGRAAEQATVTAYVGGDQSRFVRDELRKVRQVQAGADGTFSVAVPSSAEWVLLVAESPGWAVGWSGWTHRRPDRPVSVELSPASTLSGRVVDEAGKPVPAATVRVHLRRPASRWGWVGGAAVQALQTVTDPDGRFAFRTVPAGAKARFEARAKGHGMLDPFRGSGDSEVATPCEDVELALPPEARVEAMVVEKGTGRPVEDVDLVVVLWEKTGGQPPTRRAKGRFCWENLPPGRGRVFLNSPPDRPGRWVGASVDIEAKAGETTEVRMELLRGQTAEVVVKDAETAQPVDKAEVWAWNPRNRLEASGQSGPDGIVRLCVVPGTYEVRWARAPKYAAARQDMKLSVEEGKPARAEVLLKKAPRVHGVVRGPDGRPVGDVEVAILRDWGGEISDPDGRIEIYREYTEQQGPGMILLARDAGRNLVATATVPDLSSPVDIALRPGEVRSVRVADSSGQPLARARITATIGWFDPEMPSGQFEAISDEGGLARVPALPADLPIALRVQCRGYSAVERLLAPGRAAGAETQDVFRLNRLGRDLPAAKAERIDIPPIPGQWAIWGATGQDERGCIWFGVTAHDVEAPSAHLFEYDPRTGKVTDRGDVVGQLKAAGVLRQGEGQMKIHTRICQVGDYLYFASMDEQGEDEVKGVLPTYGGHLWRMSLKDYRWEHLKAAPEAMIALAAGGGKVYALGYWGHVLFQYDTAGGTVRSVKVGAPAGHVSRNIIADNRGHAYVPRVTEGPTGPEAVLVEFDQDLNELRSTPLPGYFDRSPRNSHGITGLAPLADGSIAFVTHNGFLSLIRPSAQGPAEVTHLGWFHPDGPRYAASLFADPSGRFLMGEVHGGSDRAYVWIVYDLQAGVHRVGVLEVSAPAGLSLGPASLYGSVARDEAGACYVVGIISSPDGDGHGRSEPILLKVTPPNVGP